jgi:ferredoxin-NADP reductase
MKLYLSSVHNLEGDVKTFIFDSNEPISWIAGQYVHIVIKHTNEDSRGNERWFTISSAPSDGKIAISTRIISDNPSSFKRALNSLKLGDEVEADKPEGDFILKDLAKNYIFVAGGIGITPFHSIIREASIKNTMPKIILLYANRTFEVAFKSELDSIRSENSNLKINYIYSPVTIDKKLLDKTIRSVDQPTIYVSGPEPMVESFVKILTDVGVSKDNILADFFPGYEVF